MKRRGMGGTSIAPPEGNEPRLGPLAELESACRAWADAGRRGPLGRWLERQLDAEGVPRVLSPVDWPRGLRLLQAAIEARADPWPEQFDAIIEGWLRMTLRFSRPDASSAFGPTGGHASALPVLRWWARRLSDPGLERVVDWWFPTKQRVRYDPPPIPAHSRPDRPLAVLRETWARDGDFIAIDDGVRGMPGRFEVCLHGIPWLGPWWGFPEGAGGSTRPKPLLWSSQSAADVSEWSFRVGRARVTRTAILFRGRRLALLAEEWNGPGDPGVTRWSLAEGVTCKGVPDLRALVLSRPGARLAPRILPIGLSRSPEEAESGSLTQEGSDLVLRQPPTGRRSWRALVVSWDRTRDRKGQHWRFLTVTENRRVCPPDVALAARLSWGRDDTLLVYRSLAAPANRAFLGHQSRARFLVGLFDGEGEVRPLVKIED